MASLLIVAGLPTSKAADVVTYEAFGAAGDGVSDDLPAIVEVHDHANRRGLPVRSNPDATCHLERKALTAFIATHTDWSTSLIIGENREIADSVKLVP